MLPATVPCIKIQTKATAPHEATFKMDASDCPVPHKPFMAMVQYGSRGEEVQYVFCGANEISYFVVKYGEKILRSIRIFPIDGEQTHGEMLTLKR